MIDIIIPAYNSHETIENTLFSIAYQDIADKCKIYIVNDNSVKNYGEIINFFSNFINIKELKLDKNCGPGGARQFGIDNSKNEYIIFIDSDDVFSSPYSISTLYNEINKSNYDVIISDFVEETNEGFILKNKNNIWLHGKIYKRKFLKDNNIKFNDSRSNEDNGFNQLIYLCNAQYKYINIKTYIWKNNQNSITRCNNHKFRFEGNIGYIYNINWAITEAIKRNGNKDKISELLYDALIYIYFIYLEFYKNKDINKIINEAFKLNRLRIKYDLDDDKKRMIFENQYNNYYDDYTKHFLINPFISFNEFLNNIEKEII